jgi:hypothetical protein
MKTALARVLPVLFFLLFTKFAVAGDFVSAVVPTGTTLPITVPADRFLVIRNFTQEGGTNRGVVSVMTNTFTANNVLTATIVDPMASPGMLEVINNVVIAGPATVTITPGDTTCFITYRKGTD